MNADRARELIEQSLLDIVPDADVDGLRPDTEIRQALELDSLDFQELVERLSTKAGYRIDEEDYGRLRTMGAAVEFIAARASATT